MLDKSALDTPLQNLSQQEVERFDRLADQWWDPKGKYQTALAFNQARLSFISAQIKRHFPDRHPQTLRILDVGSGGGLISESLALLGYDVTGVDPSSVSVQVATQHASGKGLTLKYIHGLASELATSNQQFDVVINAEVVEHVPDQQALIDQCCSLVAPDGLMLLATLNRTFKAWVIAIFGAEYVMRYLPIGTHSWKKFVKPKELLAWSEHDGFRMLDSTGLALNPFTKKWSLNHNLGVNYVLSLARQ